MNREGLHELSQACLRALDGASRACVAYSGGSDSTALLIAACEALGAHNIFALHVNHGLQASASLFEDHATQACSRLGCALEILRVEAGNAKGQSPEDAARIARYRALAAASTAREATCLLGQHAEDQAETFILAASRGLGPMGLSGMGERFERHGAAFARPLLKTPKKTILDFLEAREAPWIEDPTNADPHFARNMARAQAMPALYACFPHFAQSAARAMALCAQTQAILDDMAQIDADSNPEMDIQKLQALSDARLANLLRRWLAKEHASYPGHAQIEEAIKQIRAATNKGRNIDIKCGCGKLARGSNKTRLAFLADPQSLQD
jgi:tRNA(Ile)-lysidine synthase